MNELSEWLPCTRRKRSALSRFSAWRFDDSTLWRGFDLSTHEVYSTRKFEQPLTNIDER